MWPGSSLRVAKEVLIPAADKATNINGYSYCCAASCMPVQQEATILVPSDDPKNKKSEKSPNGAADNSKGKVDAEELVSVIAS